MTGKIRAQGVWGLVGLTEPEKEPKNTIVGLARS